MTSNSIPYALFVEVSISNLAITRSSGNCQSQGWNPWGNLVYPPWCFIRKSSTQKVEKNVRDGIVCSQQSNDPGDDWHLGKQTPKLLSYFSFTKYSIDFQESILGIMWHLFAFHFCLPNKKRRKCTVQEVVVIHSIFNKTNLELRGRIFVNLQICGENLNV